MKTLGFLLIWSVLWTAGVALFDYTIVRDISRQQGATSYPSATGEVIHSGIKQEHTSDGWTYRAEIRFTYEVDGVAHESNTWRYGTMTFSDRSFAEYVASKYPVGAAVRVYYNPDHPGDAILERDAGGQDFFTLLFVTPFNVVAIGMWLWIGRTALLIVRKPIAGGISIRRRGDMIYARVPSLPPILVGLIVAMIVCVVGIIGSGLAFDMQPSLEFIYGVWIAAAFLGGGVYLRQSFVVGTGAKDLVIDPVSRMLDLPRTDGREQPTMVPFDSISSIEFQQGCSDKDNTNYAVIRWENEHGQERLARVASFVYAFRAESFVDWLSEQVGRQSGSAEVDADAGGEPGSG